MARKKVGRAAVAARWSDRVARWRASGLSVAEFARRERVHPASLYYWRRRFPEPAQRGRRGSRTSRAFLPVELVAEDSAEAAPQGERASPLCELVLGSLVCRVPRELDEDALRRVVRLLREEASRC